MSYVAFGGYTHSIFNKKNNTEKNNIDSSYVPNLEQVYAEHNKIDIKTDTIKKNGTVKLTKIHEEIFIKGNFIFFDNTKTIHQIGVFDPNTLTINFLSDVGGKEIDVFISHKTPERKVFSKSDTRMPIEKKVSFNVVEKCLMILKTVSSTNIK